MEPVAKRVLTAVEPETERLEVVALEKIAFVAWKMEAKRDVEVELVKVPLVALKSEAKNEVEVELVMFELLPESMEEKKEVEVEFEVVLLIAVKFWRVEDPVATRLGVVKRPVESIVVVAVPPA